MTWILANWIAVLAVGSTGLLLAERIADATPTKVDNKILGIINRVIGVVGNIKKEK